MITEVATKTEVARKPAVRGVLILFTVLLLSIGAALVFAVLPRLARQKTLLADSRADNVHVPVVLVAKVQRAASTDVLELPGNLLAFNEAPIYARIDGYIRRRLVDISYKVKKGDLMMELDTPELDQQIHQAEAALSQSQAVVQQFAASLEHAKANVNLAKVTLDRWKRLTEQGVFAKQEEDEKQANYDLMVADVASAEANLAAAKNAVTVSEANLSRLRETKAFSRITAPFDGVVSGRYADAGALVTAGNTSGNHEVFRLAQLDPIRVYVDVPQTYVDPIRATAKHPATLTVEQLPGRTFPGTVMDTNSALDPASRTMLAVVWVPNPKGELLPGMFGRVKFRLTEAFRPLVVPGDTVMSRSDGPRVAVVNQQMRVELRRIDPGRDYGSRMEVMSGVKDGELLIVNPTDEVREGVQVQVQVQTAK
jgi:RND family efflux transporter MFP subunit